jgi:hypothetical protein
MCAARTPPSRLPSATTPNTIQRREPAIPGPPIWAPERLISSFEFASTRSSRSMSDGRYDW